MPALVLVEVSIHNPELYEEYKKIHLLLLRNSEGALK